MAPLILPLSDLEATIEALGGKGMSLAKLYQAGLLVPGGFHVTTEAYRRFLLGLHVRSITNEAHSNF